MRVRETIWPVGPTLLCLGLLGAAACKGDIEPDRVDAAARYSELMCACSREPDPDEAKKCAVGVMEPKDPTTEHGVFTGPSYSHDAMHGYLTVKRPGLACDEQIQARWNQAHAP